MKYQVKVKPASSKNLVEEKDGQLIVYTTKSAHDNEANIAAIELLSKYFKIPKTSIKIASGAHSKNKVIEF